MDTNQITIERADPLDVEADALLHPTTGAEAPEGERLDGVYQRAGDTVLEELQRAQPIRIGESATTGGGDLSVTRIVHIPIQTAPGVPTTIDNIQTSLRTGIVGLDEEDTASAVIPALLPPDPTDLDLDELVDVVAQDLIQYPTAHLESLSLVDRSEQWIEKLTNRLRSMG